MSDQKQLRIIEVVPYNPAWKKEYEKEAAMLMEIFLDEIITIHHIGSTSIPGIYAKPVIDIMIEVKAIDRIDKYNHEMEQLGYIPRGEGGIPGRRFFMKGLYDRTHHVHAFGTGNPELEKHLNFRDYITAHPKAARQYEELKKALAEKFRYDSIGYVNGKDAFIKDIDIKAKKWAERKDK
ncbi:MAG: GrpB family protein [Bacillota bacterium]